MLAIKFRTRMIERAKKGEDKRTPKNRRTPLRRKINRTNYSLSFQKMITTTILVQVRAVRNLH
jgi:hypothetical protein